MALSRFLSLSPRRACLPCAFRSAVGHAGYPSDRDLCQPSRRVRTDARYRAQLAACSRRCGTERGTVSDSEHPSQAERSGPDLAGRLLCSGYTARADRQPAPAMISALDGVSAATSGCGCLPPDTEGDVSDVHLHPVGQYAVGRLRQDRRLRGAGSDQRQFVLGRLRRPVRNHELGRPDRAVGSARATLDHESVRHLAPFATVRRGFDHVRSAGYLLPLRVRFGRTSATIRNSPCGPTTAAAQDAYLLTTHEFTGPELSRAPR